MDKIFSEIKKLQKNEAELLIDSFVEFLNTRNLEIVLENKYSISGKKGKIGLYINYININNILYITHSFSRLYNIYNNNIILDNTGDNININIILPPETEKSINNILLYIYNYLSKSNSIELPKSSLSFSENEPFLIDKHFEVIPEYLTSFEDFLDTYHSYILEQKRRFDHIQTLQDAKNDFVLLCNNSNPIHSIKKCILNKQQISKYNIENNRDKKMIQKRKKCRLL